MIAQSVHIQNAGKKNYQLLNFAGYFALLIFTRTFYFLFILFIYLFYFICHTKNIGKEEEKKKRSGEET